MTASTKKDQVFSDESRIWIYSASRQLNAEEILQIEKDLNFFAKEWTAHSQSLLAKGWIEDKRFLLLMVDESQAGASGCSIDSSVAFLRELGKKNNLELFDRLTFYFKDAAGVLQPIHKEELAHAYQKGVITNDTLFANTLVSTYGDFKNNWWVPLRESWHRRFL